MVPAQTTLTSVNLAVIASMGQPTVSAADAPRVAIITTGDELARPGEPLGAAQIYDSHWLMLQAQARLALGEEGVGQRDVRTSEVALGGPLVPQAERGHAAIEVHAPHRPGVQAPHGRSDVEPLQQCGDDVRARFGRQVAHRAVAAHRPGGARHVGGDDHPPERLLELALELLAGPGDPGHMPFLVQTVATLRDLAGQQAENVASIQVEKQGARRGRPAS